MAGKFEIYQDKGGKFRFRLKAGNGQIILTSQGYTQRMQDFGFSIANNLKVFSQQCS